MYRQLILISILFFNSAFANADAFLLFEQFMAKAKNVNLQFSQITKDEKGTVINEESGSIDFVQPDKFRLQFDSPDSSLFVSDGKIIWLYEASLSQVIKRPFTKEVRTGLLTVFGEGMEGLQKEYVISTGLGGEIAWINAKAIEATNTVPAISLGFNRADGMLKQVRVSDAFGGSLEMTIKQIQFGTVDESIFKFVPPAGTEIVSQ